MRLVFLLTLFTSLLSGVEVGVGVRDLTPPLRSPSAGHLERGEKPMTAIHDPLQASALFLDNGEKKIVFCSVDSLGFLREMDGEIIRRVREFEGLESCEVYISSTHTHSGGGAYFNTPEVGELIGGIFDQALYDFYIERTVEAILEAYTTRQQGRVGIANGYISELTVYNGNWPEKLETPRDLTLLAVETKDTPLALLFHYAIYPDVLVLGGDVTEEEKFSFSADVIGSTRQWIKSLIHKDIVPLFFNGPTADLLVRVPNRQDRFASCEEIGEALAHAVYHVWSHTEVSDQIEITSKKETYLFEPKPTFSGYLLPIEPYETEINLLVFNQKHAFITIPAEISCTYDPLIRDYGEKLGLETIALMQLVNDNHGYIFSPASWRLCPDEVEFAWGGEMYGQFVEEKIINLLQEAK